MTTAVAPISCRRVAATRICSRFVTASPVRAAASSTLGVMTVACGSNRSTRRRRPAASIRSLPDDDLMMGSRTTLPNSDFSRKSLTARATFPEPSMPMWTAEISRSALSSCKRFRNQLGTDRLNPLHPRRGLDGQSRDTGHAVATVGGDGLHVRRHPGSGRGVESGNGENHGWRLGHRGNVPVSDVGASVLARAAAPRRLGANAYASRQARP